MIGISSDIRMKTNFRNIDPDEILEKLERLPVSKWKYIGDRKGPDHIGPMAQDFRSIFEVGESNTVIHPVDAWGVALAAIQALSAKVKRLEEMAHAYAE